jgi:hypothetical protein
MYECKPVANNKIGLFYLGVQTREFTVIYQRGKSAERIPYCLNYLYKKSDVITRVDGDNSILNVEPILSPTPANYIQQYGITKTWVTTNVTCYYLDKGVKNFCAGASSEKFVSPEQDGLLDYTMGIDDGVWRGSSGSHGISTPVTGVENWPWFCPVGNEA